MSLVIENVSKSFQKPGSLLFGAKEFVHALKNVSLTVELGQSLGIVGESGSGKTTLAKIIAGFLSPDQGKVSFDGTDLVTISRFDRSKIVQMVFQDPYASLNPKLILRSQLREAMSARHDEAALMADVGLPEDFLARYPHQLSGGQRQRFAIARALAAHPRLLVADESVSSLDLSIQAQIIQLLNKLRAEHKFTQIVISHDLAVIGHLCDSIVVMKDGEIVENGTSRTLLSQPRHPYTQRLLAASR